MSRESDIWLQMYTLIGCTDKRGTAWHYRSDLQRQLNLEPNHYPGYIPLEDVDRRLFNFVFQDTAVTYVIPGDVQLPHRITAFELGGQTYTLISSTEDRKGMLTSDTFEDLGMFKDSYQGHQYREWLIDAVASVIDAHPGELGIGSAGLLQKRAQAWVSIELPDNITTPEGVEFRPNLLSATSFNGTIATFGKVVNTNVVCDNTLELARSENGGQYKVKHTKYSGLKIAEARNALQLIFDMADDFAAEVAELTAWKVSDYDFERLLDAVVPLPEEEGRGKTMAGNKRDQIVTLYRNDNRAAPWKGTAFGVLAAFNTWNQHYSTVKGNVPRIVRNMGNVLSGTTHQQDTEILEALRVLAPVS